MRRVMLTGPRGHGWVTEVPTTRRERVRGLLGRDGLPDGHALLLKRARSVHTFGMRFPIEVVFLDGRLRVLSVRHAKPVRLLLPRFRARHVLECPEGTDLRPGDRLEAGGLLGGHERADEVQEGGGSLKQRSHQEVIGTRGRGP